MLYPTFMGCLSACPFEWDAGDLALLRQMTREQLRQGGVLALTDLLDDRRLEQSRQEGVLALTDLLVDRRISRRELSQYCCRRTCGVEAAISLIERLLQELVGGGPDCCCLHAAHRCPSLSCVPTICQYKGIIYCPSVEAVPEEQWLE